jgi:hypothetical protein
MQLGPDRLVKQGDRLLISSPTQMPEWTRGDRRRTAIIFRGVVFAVEEHEYLENERRFLYSLKPWPEDSPEIPGRLIEYNLGYVRKRDEVARREKRHQTTDCLFLLAPLWPLLGLLPQSLKSTLEEEFGLPSRRITMASIFSEYAVVVVCSALVSIDVGAYAFGQAIYQVKQLAFDPFWPALAAFIAAPDALIRHHRVLDRGLEPGFYEWLFRRN